MRRSSRADQQRIRRRLPCGGQLAAQGESDSFRIPSGQEGEELRFTAASGTPVVTLTGPGGQTFTTPSAPGQLVRSGDQFIAAVAPDHNQLLVFLRRPQGGEWHVQAATGSPAIAKLETAADVAPATVRVHVARGHGASWALTYRIAHHVPGTRVMFVERGRDSTHVLGTVSAAKGTITFVPQDAISRARRIVAYLLNTQGAPQRVLTVGRYAAPGPVRPGRVKRVRIVRHGLTALVSWGAAARARVYMVKVRGSDGRLQMLRATPQHPSVQLANVLPFESFKVTVTARGGPNLLAGGTAAAKLAAVKLRSRVPVKQGRARSGRQASARVNAGAMAALARLSPSRGCQRAMAG